MDTYDSIQVVESRITRYATFSTASPIVVCLLIENENIEMLLDVS
jgi:hypothetical protein